MFWTAQVFHILGVKNIARIKGSSTNIYLCGLLLLFHKYEYGLIHVYILTGLVIKGPVIKLGKCYTHIKKTGGTRPGQMPNAPGRFKA